MVERFNDPVNKRVKCTLISTKAGSLGINLHAANRVIIVDGSWNPTYDLQAIYRAWRCNYFHAFFFGHFLFFFPPINTFILREYGPNNIKTGTLYKLEGLFESLRARMMGTVIGLQKIEGFEV